MEAVTSAYFVAIPRKPVTHIQKSAPGATPVQCHSHTRDVPNTDGGGEGGGERLKVGDIARLVGVIVPPRSRRRGRARTVGSGRDRAGA